MDANASNLDIQHHQEKLEKTLLRFSKYPVAPHTIRLGLNLTSDLKTLSAMHRLAHLEQYVAQVEQLLLKANATPMSRETHERLLHKLSKAEREFRASCHYLEERQLLDTGVSRAETTLLPLLDTLFMMEKEGKYANHRTQQQTDEKSSVPTGQHPSLRSMIQSFVPWIHQTAYVLKKDIDVTVHIPDSLFIMREQTLTSLHRMMIHLLRNAVVHGIEYPSVRTAMGKPHRGSIHLEAQVLEDTLVLSVTDNGKGLPDGFSLRSDCAIPLSYGKISTVPSENVTMQTSIYAVSNVQTGLGVGLHIVQSMASKMDGEFKLTSTPGQGTTAMVCLPLDIFQRNTASSES